MRLALNIYIFYLSERIFHLFRSFALKYFELENLSVIIIGFLS